MQNHITCIEKQNTNCGEAANLQGIRTYYYDNSFLIKGCQMDEILTLGWLIGFCRHAM
jgi:hypothetical protein